MRVYFVLFLYLIIGIAFQACKEEDICDGAICLTVFNSSAVTVTDTLNQPVILDDFSVTVLRENRDITQIDSTFNSQGKYNLVSDGIFGDNESKQIQFKGFIKQEEVVNETYFITTDCCSYDILSGETNLVVR